MVKKEMDACLDQMSYMFQGNAPFDSMTVYENVAIPIREKANLSKSEIDRRVMARIEQAELGEARHGSHLPNILREVNPAQTDILYCLTDSDRANFIASLVGRSLGFKRVVTAVGDAQFEGICHELGLKDTIIPSRTISRYLEGMVGGTENVELSTVLQDEARFSLSPQITKTRSRPRI